MTKERIKQYNPELYDTHYQTMLAYGSVTNAVFALDPNAREEYKTVRDFGMLRDAVLQAKENPCTSVPPLAQQAEQLAQHFNLLITGDVPIKESQCEEQEREVRNLLASAIGRVAILINQYEPEIFKKLGFIYTTEVASAVLGIPYEPWHPDSKKIGIEKDIQRNKHIAQVLSSWFAEWSRAAYEPDNQPEIFTTSPYTRKEKLVFALERE